MVYLTVSQSLKARPFSKIKSKIFFYKLTYLVVERGYYHQASPVTSISMALYLFHTKDSTYAILRFIEKHILHKNNNGLSHQCLIPPFKEDLSSVAKISCLKTS